MRPTVAREIAAMALLAVACVCLVLLALHAIDDRSAPLGSFAGQDYQQSPSRTYMPSRRSSSRSSSGSSGSSKPATCFDGNYSNDHGAC
jgi:hypothetical protein